MRTKEEISHELAMSREQQDAIVSTVKELERELVDSIAEFKIGQRVIEKYGSRVTEYEITSSDLWYRDKVCYRGKKVLKSGALHKNETRLYGDLIAKPAEETK